MLDSPAFGSRELQGSMIGVSVVLHDQPADLHEVVAVTANRKVDGIGHAILRQVWAIAGITEVAALAEFLVGRRDAFVSGGRAVPGKTIAQRKAPAMRPQLGFVPDGRKEVGTGQRTLAGTAFGAHCSPGRAVEIRGNLPGNSTAATPASIWLWRTIV